MKYAFVRAHSPEFRVSRMCQVLKVSRSGYYDWQGRSESPRSQRDQVLLKEIRQIHEQTKEAYGAIKLKAEIRYNWLRQMVSHRHDYGKSSCRVDSIHGGDCNVAAPAASSNRQTELFSCLEVDH